MLQSIKLLLTFFLTLSITGLQAQDGLLKQLEKNLTEYFLTEDNAMLNSELNKLTEYAEIGDQVIAELFQKRNANLNLVQHYISTFNTDSTWEGINYQDNNRSAWQLKIHADRVLLLTKFYLSKDSKFYNNPQLRTIIHNALGYWFVHMPIAPNWWQNEIGIPKTLGPVLIMMKHELSPHEIQAGIKVLNQAKFGMTGQNKVWLAGNVFYNALLQNNLSLAQEARDIIFSEISISEDEGIKSDYSFQQHGPQQQFGNYGLAFLITLTSWAKIFDNTTLEINSNKLEIIRNLFEYGYNQLSWNGYFDLNSLGRQFFNGTQRLKALSIGYAANDLIAIDTEHKHIYENYINRNFGVSAPDPKLIKFSNYYTSDMSVYRSHNWYASIKMSSNRVIGAESLNQENLKGYYLADGACYISTKGNEYFNIFPVWNWRKLPGITAPQSDSPLKQLDKSNHQSHTDFAGSLSSGLNGITAFHLDRDSLNAKKAYFFLNNQLICLGAAINFSQDDPVVTTLNQSLINGAVTFSANKITTLNSETALFKVSNNWVYHDAVTYIPMFNTKFDISNKSQQGSWQGIMKKYPSDTVTGKIFTISIPAIKNPINATYAYAFLPGTTIPLTKKINLPFNVIKNDDNAQIVISKDKKIVQMVVYNAINTRVKGVGDIYINQPGLYQFENNNNQWQVTMADPTQLASRFELKFNSKTYTYNMPEGAEKGKSIQMILQP